MPSNTFEIRDLRQTDWVWASKQVLFHEGVDASAYKVYSGLASYAGNETQKAYPSIATLSTKLHLSKNTVIRAIATLEAEGIIRRDKTKGEHNVYYLLSVVATDTLPKSYRKEKKAVKVEEAKEPTPQQDAKKFFEGVAALRRKEEVPWLADFLRSAAEKYAIDKGVLWRQVQDFGAYWTERNPTGTKERWEMQKTFEVSLRLQTWFRRADVLGKQPQALAKRKGIIGLNVEAHV